MTTEAEGGNKDAVEMKTTEQAPPVVSQLQVEEVGKETESKAHRSTLEYVDLVYRVISSIFFVGVWIVMIGMWLYFLMTTVTQLIDSMKQPGTTVSYPQNEIIEFPMVTICNYFYDTGIQADYCLFLADGTDCMSKIQAKEYYPEDGLYTQYCLQFNFDKSSPLRTNKTGRRGGVLIGFSIEADYDDDTIDWAQVTFTVPGVDPSMDMLDDEIRYVQGGRSIIYGAQMIKQTNLNGTEQINYETTSSDFIMTPFPPPQGQQYAEVAVAFRTLQTQQISEIRTYQFQNFIGDNSGVIGTLTGISVIKFLGILARIYPSIRARSLTMIGDLLTS